MPPQGRPLPTCPSDSLLFAERSGFVPPLQTPALVQGLAPSAPGWLSGASGHPEAGREPIAAARGQPGSQALGFSLGTGSSLGLHLCFCTWCRGWTPLSSEAPGHGGLGSPVLLPRVTAAGVGLPQLGGEHPDDVDEEDEVELWERGRAASRGCSPAGRGARTRGPTAPPGLCSAAASPGGSLGPQVPHLDQDGDRLPLRPCGCDPGVQGSFYWSPSGPRPWGREPTPPPSPVATLLTTMEARMGTWMIHFLFPELKSQHLGEVEASAPSLLSPP